MKRILPIILFFTLLLISCDIVPEKERLIEMKELPRERVVLLEKYTGQKCINCPTADIEVAKLHEVYQENLIVVAMHAGVFSLKKHRTKAGDIYNEYFGVSNYPNGMVNRRKSSTGVLLNYVEWGQKIREIIWQKSGVKIEVQEAAYEASEDSLLHVKVKIDIEKGLVNRNLAFQIWIIENKITAVQLMPDGSKNKDYIHNHVFRDAVNGIWGEKLTFKEREAFVESTDYSLNGKNWNLSNGEVVVFVYDKESKEILEAKKQKLQLKQIN